MSITTKKKTLLNAPLRSQLVRYEKNDGNKDVRRKVNRLIGKCKAELSTTESSQAASPLAEGAAGKISQRSWLLN